MVYGGAQKKKIGCFFSELFVLTLITVLGCLKTFDANGGNEGRLYVFRAICLSVPVGIRVNVIRETLIKFIFFHFSKKSLGNTYVYFTLLGIYCPPTNFRRNIAPKN